MILRQQLTRNRVNAVHQRFKQGTISGVFIKGTKALNTPAQSIDVSEYVAQVQTLNIAKLKRDKLMVCNDDGTEFVAANVYSSLVAQVEYEGQKYILCMGSWYLIHDAFYNKVAACVNTIERKDDLLPVCVYRVRIHDHLAHQAASGESLPPGAEAHAGSGDDQPAGEGR